MKKFPKTFNKKFGPLTVYRGVAQHFNGYAVKTVVQLHIRDIRGLSFYTIRFYRNGD